MASPERRRFGALGRRADEGYKPNAERDPGHVSAWAGVQPVIDLRMGRSLGSELDQPESPPSEFGTAASTLLIGEREHRFYVLTPERLEYIEANGNYVKLHTREFEYISRDTLKRVNSLLAGCGFLRIERSVLINLRAISYVQRTHRRRYAFTLLSGTCLHSGANFRDEILRALPLPHSSHSRTPR